MLLRRLAALKNKRFQALIVFALREGWQVKMTLKGNVQLKRKGCATIYNAAYLIENASYKIEKRINNLQSNKNQEVPL